MANPAAMPWYALHPIWDNFGRLKYRKMVRLTLPRRAFPGEGQSRDGHMQPIRLCTEGCAPYLSPQASSNGERLLNSYADPVCRDIPRSSTVSGSVGLFGCSEAFDRGTQDTCANLAAVLACESAVDDRCDLRLADFEDVDAYR